MRKLLLMIVFSPVLFTFTNAQRSKTQFIEVLTSERIGLSPEMQKRYDHMVASKLYSEMTLVRIGDLSAIQKNGSFQMTIPGRLGKIAVDAKSVEATSENEYVWLGETRKEKGAVIIAAREGRIFGHINLGGEVYEIHDLGNTVNLLVKPVLPVEGERTCATDHTVSATQRLGDTESGEVTIQSGPPNLVRVLILYTQSALEAVPNINDVAALAHYQLYAARSNSAVTNLDFDLAGVEYINFNEGTKIKEDVIRLKNSSIAQSLRNIYEADIVILLTNVGYTDAFGAVDSLGPVNSRAYGIVEISSATSIYTFAHEVGHIFGARHSSDITPTFARGSI